MSYLFPIAFMLNTFAMTAFLVVLGLAGKSTMAADVGIVQGATLALFYAFSANARSVILNPTSRISVRSVLLGRILLLGPLGILALYLSVYVTDVAGIFALALILRRSAEWVSEVHLSEMERRGRREFAGKFIVLQAILLLLVLGWTLGGGPMPVWVLFLWGALPLVMSLGFVGNVLRTDSRFGEGWIQMLPHFGSTAMIGITVYVFRLLIMLIVGKEIAGDLYTAFAMGSVMGSVFATALGPSLVLHELRSGERHFPTALKMSLGLWFVGGTALFVGSEFAIGALDWMGKSSFFWGATGLSMIGGVVMVFAQRIRLRLLQLSVGNDVYGPDVLINILILVSVPYLYYVVGKDALMALYLLSATFALLFYASSKERIAWSEHPLGVSRDTWKGVIGLLLFLPLFFQLTGNIFHDPALFFDSEGALMRVPLPLSLLACYGGIALLGDYKHAYLSLRVIFLSFVLMLTSSVVSTHGQITEELGKIILLVQFIVPMCALALGQVYEAGARDDVIFEKVFLYVLSVLVPVQLVFTWLQGQVLLSPYFYLFSIHQHLQYVPVMFVCGYLIALYSLWHLPQYKKILFILAPLMGIYVAASASMVALVALSGGVLGFVLYRSKCGSDKSLIVAYVLMILVSGGYLSAASNDPHVFSQKFAFIGVKPSHVDVQEVKKQESASLIVKSVQPGLQQDKRLVPNVAARLHYWEYYAKNITSGWREFLTGHAKHPDRSKYPSAHNYYLDFVYNFGVLAFLPLMSFIGYTLLLVYRCRQAILASSGLLGLTVVVFILLFVDNSLKVGLRQPYPGIISFFLWAVLLSRLSRLSTVTKYSQKHEGSHVAIGRSLTQIS